MVKKDDSAPGIEPSMENVLSGKYPISRYLYWYTAGNPSGEIKKLVGWVLGQEGQKLVQEVGYYPLPKSK
jgi:phosphate transport system substrate-binding protein